LNGFDGFDGMVGVNNKLDSEIRRPFHCLPPRGDFSIAEKNEMSNG
jgi:hypothetical protein